MKRAVLLATLLVTGCGELGIETNPPSVPTTTAPIGTPDEEVAMCELMPLADVQAKSPFQTPLARAEEGAVPGMCEFRSAEDAEEPVSVLLVITEFGSGRDARTSLANQRQAAVDAGIPVTDIDGLGEEAFGSGSDEVGVHARIDRFVIDANMGGEWPDTTDDAKVTAGTELVRTILSRLP